MSALEEAAAGRIMSIWISWQCASVGCMMNGRYRLVRDREQRGCEKSPLKVKRTLSGMKPGGVLFFVVKLSYYE